MIKYQVLHLQPFGQASRIHGRTVMLLVRLEAVAVGIQAESLTQEPVGSLHLTAVALVVWLVSQADQPLSVGQVRTETKLLFLCREDVKRLEFQSASLKFLTVLHLTQVDSHTQAGHNLCGQCHAANPVDYLQGLVVPPHPQFSFILSLLHLLRHGTDHPDNSQYMIGVCVGYKNIVNVSHGDTGLFQLYQDSVSASRIRQQYSPVCTQCKTGIVATGHGCIPRAQHNQFSLSHRFIQSFSLSAPVCLTHKPPAHLPVLIQAKSCGTASILPAETVIFSPRLKDKKDAPRPSFGSRH